MLAEVRRTRCDRVRISTEKESEKCQTEIIELKSTVLLKLF